MSDDIESQPEKACVKHICLSVSCLVPRNRALLQRCKKEDISSSHDYPGMRLVNGWREWESLDALFDSMGPSPMVMSEELGPQVSRGYQHASSVAACSQWLAILAILAPFLVGLSWKGAFYD